jgi:hypothetical protein
MAVDADVVRCAAPWPGLAAQLVEGMAALGPGPWSIGRLCAAAAAGVTTGDALPVLSGLAIAGVCDRATQDDYWTTPLSEGELRRLSELLRGAEHYRRLRFDAQSVEITVTMPLAPSRLEEQLGSAPGRPGGYLSTYEAFLRVANMAQKRLVVLTPFLDGRGFGWLKEIIERTQPNAEKILVLREADRYTAELGVHHSQWLRAANVSVRDYHLPHTFDSGRALAVETFHAKVLLADEQLAYVGSANILGSGDGTSLEAGVLVYGRAASQVARLVEGILRVARRL